MSTTHDSSPRESSQLVDKSSFLKSFPRQVNTVSLNSSLSKISPRAHPTFKRVMESRPSYPKTTVGHVDPKTGRLIITPDDIDINKSFGLDSILENIEFNGAPVTLSQVLSTQEKLEHIENQIKLLRICEKHFMKSNKMLDEESSNIKRSVRTARKPKKQQNKYEPQDECHKRTIKTSPGISTANTNNFILETVDDSVEIEKVADALKNSIKRKPRPKLRTNPLPSKSPQTFEDISSENQKNLTTADKISMGLLVPVYESGTISAAKPTNSGGKHEHKPGTVNRKSDNNKRAAADLKSRKEVDILENDNMNNDSQKSKAILERSAEHHENQWNRNKTANEEESQPQNWKTRRKAQRERRELSSGVENDLALTASSSNDCANLNSCRTCAYLGKKIKNISLTTESLQRQNGCLESIIKHKRNLVEQLTKQVRNLQKENIQLVKGSGLLPTNLHVPSLASLQDALLEIPNATPAQLIFFLNELIKKGSTDEALPLYEPPAKGVSRGKRKAATAPTNGNGDAEQNIDAVLSPTTKPSFDDFANQGKHVVHLQNKCKRLESECSSKDAKTQEKQRFINDLLYTLNARGYESIIDFDGTSIDLFKCRAEHLLDLRGRDARIRVPCKKPVPQELLLKSIIGSQAQFIKSVMDMQMSDNISSRLSSEINSDDGKCEMSASNAVLESEVLALCGLIEGACLRNPDLLHALKEQHYSDSQVQVGNNSSVYEAAQPNIVVDAVLERCQKALCSSTPPSPRIRYCSDNREREPSNPRSGTPTPYSQFGKCKPATSKSPRRLIMESQRPASAQINWHPSTAYSRSPSRPCSRNPNRDRPQSKTKMGLLQTKNHSKCKYCGMKFPTDATAVEIEQHFQMHTNYQI